MWHGFYVLTTLWLYFLIFTELLQLFAELFDVVADQAVLDIDVGAVVEEVQ